MADHEHWRVPKELKKKMHVLASDLRQRSTKSETNLWAALRDRKLAGRKFRRQVPVGAFVLDFYCAEETLAVEVDGGIHRSQQQADQLRQEIIETLSIRFVRVTSEQVEKDLTSVLQTIQSHFQA